MNRYAWITRLKGSVAPGRATTGRTDDAEGVEGAMVAREYARFSWAFHDAGGAPCSHLRQDVVEELPKDFGGILPNFICAEPVDRVALGHQTTFRCQPLRIDAQARASVAL